jgi:hypothetical protein
VLLDDGAHEVARVRVGQEGGFQIDSITGPRVALDVQDMPESLQDFAWRGRVSIEADWQSPLAHYARQAAAVLVRELGF